MNLPEAGGGVGDADEGEVEEVEETRYDAGDGEGDISMAPSLRTGRILGMLEGLENTSELPAFFLDSSQSFRTKRSY